MFEKMNTNENIKIVFKDGSQNKGIRGKFIGEDTEFVYLLTDDGNDIILNKKAIVFVRNVVDNGGAP